MLCLSTAAGTVAGWVGVPARCHTDFCRSPTWLPPITCLQLPRELGAPDAAAKQLKKFASMRQVELTGALGHEEAAAAGSQRPHSRSSVDAAENGSSHHAGTLTHAEHRHHHSPERKPKAWEPAEREPLAELAALQEHEGGMDPSGRAGSGASAAGAAGQRAGGGAALLAAATGALAEGVRALREGWAYMQSRENRDVAALVRCVVAFSPSSHLLLVASLDDYTRRCVFTAAGPFSTLNPGADEVRSCAHLGGSGHN